MFDYLGERSLFFYGLLVFLTLLVLQNITIGVLYFLKSSGTKRANTFYGIFLLAMGLTLVHNILIISNFYDHFPEWKFIPIYFTLALPILLFFYVKLSLYPEYQLRFSDIKHFFLPIAQLIYFIFLFFSSLEYKSAIDRGFYNPFFGAFEQTIYIVSFFAYLYFSRRYISQRKKVNPKLINEKQVAYLSLLIQLFTILFFIHTFFILIDFFTYEFLGINLRTIKAFSGLGILSFAILVLWSGLYGFQTLIWGRKVFKK